MTGCMLFYVIINFLEIIRVVMILLAFIILHCFCKRRARSYREQRLRELEAGVNLLPNRSISHTEAYYRGREMAENGNVQFKKKFNVI
jgi:hypothetical protein